MTPEQERKVLGTLYDRIYDAISYSPEGEGRSGIFSKQNTLLQMAKNYVLNPDDFTNAASSINPSGDLKGAFAFSSMVDAIPAIGAEWADSTKTVSGTYKQIVDGANTNNAEDPAQQETYDKAYNFLNTKTEIPNFDGPPTVSMKPSQIASTYDQNQTAYVNFVCGYRAAYNNYNLDKTEDQREWQAKAPRMQNDIDQAWNKWVREGKQNVERAEDALASTINNAVAHAIKEAQEAMSGTHAMTPLETGGNKWYSSYAMPVNWYDADSDWTEMVLKSDRLNTNLSDRASDYSNKSKGLFWASRHTSSGSTEETQSHMDANKFELKAELITVQIRRPWMNSILFNMKHWWMTGIRENGISNGTLTDNDTGLMPLIPTAFIVARNVSITADFSAQDTSHFVSESTRSGSSGWGPFGSGGYYRHSRNENSRFHSEHQGGTIKLPGLQLIAWISNITPPAPPMATR